MNEKAAPLFFGPNTTQPEVEKLLAEITPIPGAIIQHDEIEAVIGQEHRTSRYRTITSAWRRRLIREHGIDLHPALGLGFEVLTSSRRIDVAVGCVKGSTRRQRKALGFLGRVEQSELTDDERTTFEIAAMQANLMHEGGKKALKLIANATKLQPLPTRKLPVAQ